MRNILWDFLFKIEKNIIFAAIKKGFMLIFPAILIGTAAVLVNSILVPLIQIFFPFLNFTVLTSFCATAYDATVGCISIYLAFSIGYYYAQYRNINNMLLRLMAVVSGVVCFIIFIGGIYSTSFVSYLGVIGVLPSIAIEILAITLFLKITEFIEVHHKSSSLGVDDNLKISLVSILPMLITVFSCIVIKYILNNVFGFGDAYEMLSNFFRQLFVDNNSEILNGILFTAMVNMLWVFGIHGGNAMNAISEEILVPLITDPNAIISKSFLDIFAQIGGSGATLFLVIAIFIVSKSKTTRGIARSASPMILFNINEIMVFGLPIMFNPILLIPFVLVPIISLCIAYIATVIGFIPVVTTVVDWTVPIFYSGYLGTQSINGVIVQLVILICGVLIYIPFVKLLDKFQVEREMRILNELIDVFKEYENSGNLQPMLTRTDALGQVARNIAHQLHDDIVNKRIEMFYQPQLNSKDKVVGVEALLRWKYNGQMIYPPFVVALAHEENILDKMTIQNMSSICDTILQTNKETNQNIHISFNLAAHQLNNIDFIKEIILLAKEKNVCNNLHLELTEETSLIGFTNITDNIKALNKENIIIEIDDFGMGHTSINYLKENHFSYVKIDGSLVKNLLTNDRCSQIITSIIELGNSLNYQVIAEYVETLEVKEKLMEMGCNLYQGYYYSAAIPKDKFIEYCKNNINKK
ncbi:MAG: EAL domain-containing protein [Clostridia bacterium]